MFIFRVNLGMWPLNSIVLENWTLFWGFQHTVYGVSQEIDPTLACDPSNLSSQNNKPCSEGFNTHLGCFQGDTWENVHF